MIKRILVGLVGTAYTPLAIRQRVSSVQSQAAEATGVTVLDAPRGGGWGAAAPSREDENATGGGTPRNVAEDSAFATLSRRADRPGSRRRPRFEGRTKPPPIRGAGLHGSR